MVIHTHEFKDTQHLKFDTSKEKVENLRDLLHSSCLYRYEFRKINNVIGIFKIPFDIMEKAILLYYKVRNSKIMKRRNYLLVFVICVYHESYYRKIPMNFYKIFKQIPELKQYKRKSKKILEMYNEIKTRFNLRKDRIKAIEFLYSLSEKFKIPEEIEKKSIKILNFYKSQHKENKILQLYLAAAVIILSLIFYDPKIGIVKKGKMIEYCGCSYSTIHFIKKDVEKSIIKFIKSKKSNNICITKKEQEFLKIFDNRKN